MERVWNKPVRGLEKTVGVEGKTDLLEYNRCVGDSTKCETGADKARQGERIFSPEFACKELGPVTLRVG